MEKEKKMKEYIVKVPIYTSENKTNVDTLFGSTYDNMIKQAKELIEKYNIPTVPIIDANYIMPDTVDEVLNYADGESAIDGGMREGIVFRDMNGDLSFKAVSNPFLLKYH